MCIFHRRKTNKQIIKIINDDNELTGEGLAVAIFCEKCGKIFDGYIVTDFGMKIKFNEYDFHVYKNMFKNDFEAQS